MLSKNRTLLSQLDPPEKSLIIMGPTGSGQTTITNIILANPLKSVKSGLTLSLQLKEVKTGQPIISHKSVSETTIPQSYYASQLSCWVTDCPGFFDNRGPEQDISNALMLEQLFQKSKLLQIVLVISITDLASSRQTELISLVKGLSLAIRDIQSLQSSFMLVVNKVTIQTVDNIKLEFMRLYEERVQTNCHSQQQLEIFQFFATQVQIKILEAPIQPDVDYQLSSTTEFLNSINSLPWMSGITLYPLISNQSRLYLANYLNELKTQLKKLFQQYLNDTYQILMSKIQNKVLCQQFLQVQKFKKPLTDFVSNDKVGKMENFNAIIKELSLANSSFMNLISLSEQIEFCFRVSEKFQKISLIIVDEISSLNLLIDEWAKSTQTNLEVRYTQELNQFGEWIDNIISNNRDINFLSNAQNVLILYSENDIEKIGQFFGYNTIYNLVQLSKEIDNINITSITPKITQNLNNLAFKIQQAQNKSSLIVNSILQEEQRRQEQNYRLQIQAETLIRQKLEKERIEQQENQRRIQQERQIEIQRQLVEQQKLKENQSGSYVEVNGVRTYLQLGVNVINGLTFTVS